MAAAARPGASEARVPCPVCGALIHPVAGRCKHCREDLRGFRNARPTALVALPRLATTPAQPRYASPTASLPGGVPGPELGVPAPPAAAATVAMPAGYAPPLPPHEARAILPPRVTGTQLISDEPDERSAWRNWPVVVIILAVVAIVGAVVVMVWPAPSATAGKRAADPALGPAPDHMDTNPLAPSGDPPPAATHKRTVPAPPPPAADPSLGTDPWRDPDSHSQIDPLPLPPDDLDHDSRLDLLTAAAQHWCRARAACPDGDPLMETACIAVAQEAVTPPSCPATSRCLANFDHMSCTDRLDLGGIQRLFATFDDCSEAARC